VISHIRSVDEPMVARREVVALSYIVIFWSLFHWHATFYEPLPDDGGPLQHSSAAEEHEGYRCLPIQAHNVRTSRDVGSRLLRMNSEY